MRSSRLRLLPAAAGAALRLVTVGLVLVGCATSPKTGPAAGRWLGDPVVRILSRPDRVTVVRTRGAQDLWGSPAVLGAIEQLDGHLPVADGQHHILSGALLRDDSYVWETDKECWPEPPVVFLFQRGSGKVAVFLDFGCEMWGVASGRKVEGTRFFVKWEDFDPVRRQLVALVKGLFPDAPEIQGLSEARDERD